MTTTMAWRRRSAGACLLALSTLGLAMPGHAVEMGSQPADSPLTTAPRALVPVSEDVQRFVVAVGYNAGPPSQLAQLRYADDDAARFYELLLRGAKKAWLLTTFDASTARAFPDLASIARAPSLAELEHVLGEAIWSIRHENAQHKKTELVFYFAGHGDVSPSGEGFLVLEDGALTRTDLYEQVVKGSPASVNHIVLDACASYFMVRPRAANGAVPVTADLLQVIKPGEDAGAWARTGVMVSTADDAAVHESSELGSGVFSYFLRSALIGAADVDGDGRVEYAEAAGYVAAASDAAVDARSRLHVHVKGPQQFPHESLLDMRTSGLDRFLSIQENDPRELRLLDMRGTPYADIHSEPGQKVLLALVGDPVYVVQTEKREAVLAPRKAGAYALSSLRFDDRSDRASEAASWQRGRAFGPAFLAGFLANSELIPPRSARSFSVPYATVGAPVFRMPWRGMAIGAAVVAGVAGVAAAACVGGNLAAFQALQQRYEKTAVINEELAFQTEAWRTAATALGIVAVASGLSAAALFAADGSDDEEREP